MSVSVVLSEERILNNVQIEVRFKHYGLKCVEVIDNGAGISETDYENIGLLPSLAPLCNI